MISHRNAAIKRKMAPLLIAMLQPKYFAIRGTRIPPTPPTAFPPVLRMPPAEEAWRPATETMAPQYTGSVSWVRPEQSASSATAAYEFLTTAPATKITEE